MEKGRKTRIYLIVALAIVVIGISIGYAAYSTTLTVNSTAASIPAGTNNLSSTVKFTAASMTSGPSGSTVGSYSGQTWSGSSVTFTSSVRSATFSATISNTSSYNVYLSSMTATGSAKLVCSGSTVSSDILSSFCSGTTATYTYATGATVVCTTTSCTSVSSAKQSYVIGASGTKSMTLTVSTSSDALPDGAISITIPGVTLGFTTAKPSS